MPLKNYVCLHPSPSPEPEIEVVKEEEAEKMFDPEAGKASDNPFHEDISYEKGDSINTVISYKDMTVKAMKDILRQRKLAIKGKKVDLIARLKASDVEAASAAPTSDEEDLASVPTEVTASEGGVSEYEEEHSGIQSDAET